MPTVKASPSHKRHGRLTWKWSTVAGTEVYTAKTFGGLLYAKIFRFDGSWTVTLFEQPPSETVGYKSPTDARDYIERMWHKCTCL